MILVTKVRGIFQLDKESREFQLQIFMVKMPLTGTQLGVPVLNSQSINYQLSVN